jgi:ABC-2 type transport system ATP-binding protein
VATLLHEPEVLILDEPMSGLDPLGADLVRGVLLEQSRQGRTIVLSSHQMETVERLCDCIGLINHGQKLLEGPLSEVKSRHPTNTIVLSYDGDGGFLSGLPGVREVSEFGRYVEVRMAEGADPQALLREAASRLRLTRFEVREPSLHDIFVAAVAS